MRFRRRAAWVALGLTAVSPLRTAPLAAQPVSRAVAVVTTADRVQLLAPLPVRSASRDARRGVALQLVVDATTQYQPMSGFGAAITDATVTLVNGLPRVARANVLRDLFHPSQGAGLSMVRVPIGASDFSTTHETLADAPPGQEDPTLRHWRVAGEAARWQLLRDIRAQQPQLLVMATPWSAPAWMKTPPSLYGGTLRDMSQPTFAQYLVRVVQAYDSAGVPIDLLSVQNEPQHAPTDYPGMRLSPAQRATLIGRHLGPQLAALPRAPRLLEWDHNWDAPDEPLAVLADAAARRYVHGVAWHCYAGDVSAQSRVHEAYPAVATYFTECAGGAWAPNFGDNLLWNTKTLIVGATRHWARGVMLWNLALDPAGGPHRGGCNDCRGVVTIDPRAGTVTRNEEFYALAHASRFVARGAVRVHSRLVSMHAADSSGVSHVAFRNPNGGVVVILVNERTTPVPLSVPMGALAMPPRSVVTVMEAGT